MAADGAGTTPAAPRAGARASEPAGLAHIAAVSFLAARATPLGGFFVALAGGVALARAGARLGLRRGYGASIAAMLQSVAMIGPARLGVPLTQALSAPLLGRMEARGHGSLSQILVCALIRTLQNALGAAFFIGIVTGLDAYASSYDEVVSALASLPVVGAPLSALPTGTGGALAMTAVLLLAWSAFASSMQVLIYRRGLDRWRGVDPEQEASAGPQIADRVPALAAEGRLAGEALDASPGGRFDPRAVTLAAAVAFGLLLASTRWPVIGGVAAWLAVVWIAAGRRDRDAAPAGVALAAILAASAFVTVLIGGLGLDTAARRACRAGLLVLVATWLRAAAGSEGLREVVRRGLSRMRAVPSLAEAGRALDEIGATPRLAAAGRSLYATLGPVKTRPLSVVDAVLRWVRAEAREFDPAERAARTRLASRTRDAVLVVLAACPAAAFVVAG